MNSCVKQGSLGGGWRTGVQGEYIPFVCRLEECFCFSCDGFYTEAKLFIIIQQSVFNEEKNKG